MRILMAAAAVILCASLIPAQAYALRALPQDGGAADRIAPREYDPAPTMPDRGPEPQPSPYAGPGPEPYPVPGPDPSAEPKPVVPPPFVTPPPVETGFVCTPGFTMVKTDTGYRLSGTLETPTPGYAYDIGEAEETGAGALTASLRLTGPDGMVTQVIDSLYINYEFQREGELSRLTLTVEKQFNWGPSSIACSYIAPEGETE